MAGALGDVAVAEQLALVDVGIEFGLAREVGQILRPTHEVRDGARRPIAIEHLQHEAAASRDRARHRPAHPPPRASAGRPAARSPRSGGRRNCARRIAHLDDRPGTTAAASTKELGRSCAAAEDALSAATRATIGNSASGRPSVRAGMHFDRHMRKAVQILEPPLVVRRCLGESDTTEAMTAECPGPTRHTWRSPGGRYRSQGARGFFLPVPRSESCRAARCRPSAQDRSPTTR